MSLTNPDIKKAEEVIGEFVRLLGVDLKPEVSADTTGLKVNLVGKDTAIIIGYHGETIGDMAYILGIILRHKLEKEFSLRLDAGGYLAAKDKKIKDLAERAIQKVKTSGFPEKLSGLNSYERRLVHEVVSKEGLFSESAGYGRERYINIKPKVEE